MYCQLNSLYDCTETWPVERLSEHAIAFHNFLLDSCLLYVLGVLLGLYSVNCIKHMIRHQSKVALQLCGKFHKSTIQSTLLQCFIQWYKWPKLRSRQYFVTQFREHNNHWGSLWIHVIIVWCAFEKEQRSNDIAFWNHLSVLWWRGELSPRSTSNLNYNLFGLKSILRTFSLLLYTMHYFFKSV